MKKARYLRFEPLESRLQFAVDYPLFAADTLSMQGTDFLTVNEFSDERLIYAVDFTRSSNISPYAFAEVPRPMEGHYWGLPAGEEVISASDSLSSESWLYADDVWLDFVEGANATDADYHDLYFGQSLLPEIDPLANTSSELAFVITDSVWYGLTGLDQTNVFGQLTDSVVFPTTLLRHGPVLDASPAVDDMIQIVALDTIIGNSIATQVPLQSQSEFAVGDNLRIHGESTLEFAVSKLDAIQSDFQARGNGRP